MRLRDRATVSHHANRHTDPLDDHPLDARPDDAPGPRRRVPHAGAGSGSDGGRRRVRPGDRRDAPEKPGPRRLADLAPDAGRLGLQPAGPDRPGERRRPAHGLDARARAGAPGGHAAGLRRRPLHAPGERRHRSDRRGDRRPDLGAPARPARGRLPARRRQLAQQPQHRHLRPVHHQHQRRQLRLRPRRRDRRDRLGNADLRLPGDPGRAQLGADHRRRQGDFRAELPAARRARVVRHRRARRAHRRGAVAAPDGAGPRGAGRRDMGRRALRAAGPRRHLDAGQLRPRAAPHLPGHVGHVAGPQVHARRRREHAPLSQLHAGSRRRYGRDPLVLPAHERPLGPRPSLRAHPARHGGRARPGRGELDQPAHPAGRGPQGDDGHSGQDRPRLHPRPRDGRVPVGHPHHRPERHQPHRRGDRRGDRETPR